MKKESLNIRLIDLEGKVAGMLIRFEKLESKVAELSTSNNKQSESLLCRKCGCNKFKPVKGTRGMACSHCGWTGE